MYFSFVSFLPFVHQQVVYRVTHTCTGLWAWKLRCFNFLLLSSFFHCKLVQGMRLVILMWSLEEIISMMCRCVPRLIKRTFPRWIFCMSTQTTADSGKVPLNECTLNYRHCATHRKSLKVYFQCTSQQTQSWLNQLFAAFPVFLFSLFLSLTSGMQ